MKIDSKNSRNVSVTREVRNTVVVDGEEIDLGSGGVDVDLESMLQGSGIDIDLIPKDMRDTVNDAALDIAIDQRANAKIKVSCHSCHRKVAYGKGKCMYCGNPLKLPQLVKTTRTGSDADAL